MKLHYFHGRAPLNTLVLRRGQRRIELHIKKVDSDVWSLIALAGEGEGHPDRVRCQGPYRDQDRASSALRALTGKLLERGYDPDRTEPAHWTVRAQRLARELRQQAKANDGRYEFDRDPSEPIF